MLKVGRFGALFPVLTSLKKPKLSIKIQEEVEAEQTGRKVCTVFPSRSFAQDMYLSVTTTALLGCRGSSFMLLIVTLLKQQRHDVEELSHTTHSTQQLSCSECVEKLKIVTA